MPEDPEPDLLDSLIKRVQEGTPDHLDRRMRDSAAIKQSEEEASQRRLEDMWAVEHRRQQSITEAQAKQAQEERMLMRYALIGAAVLILVILILTITLALAGA